jgi:hypothetical protein
LVGDRSRRADRRRCHVWRRPRSTETDL